MDKIYTLRVQPSGKRLVYAMCNAPNPAHCTVPHEYITGRQPPNYPVPTVQTNDMKALALIAAVRCDAATDFLDIGFFGLRD